MEKVGFVVTMDKCMWEPSHRVELLGFCIDLDPGELTVPTKKLLMLKS